MRLKIKICGMRDPQNIIEAARLKPDLLGFIFYPASPRYASELYDSEIIAGALAGIRKTGVFVDACFEDIILTIRKYSLDVVQLHGNETPEIGRAHV